MSESWFRVFCEQIVPKSALFSVSLTNAAISGSSSGRVLIQFLHYTRYDIHVTVGTIQSSVKLSPITGTSVRLLATVWPNAFNSLHCPQNRLVRTGSSSTEPQRRFVVRVDGQEGSVAREDVAFGERQREVEATDPWMQTSSSWDSRVIRVKDALKPRVSRLSQRSSAFLSLVWNSSGDSVRDERSVRETNARLTWSTRGIHIT